MQPPSVGGGLSLATVARWSHFCTAWLVGQLAFQRRGVGLFDHPHRQARLLLPGPRPLRPVGSPTAEESFPGGEGRLLSDSAGHRFPGARGKDSDSYIQVGRRVHGCYPQDVKGRGASVLCRHGCWDGSGPSPFACQEKRGGVWPHEGVQPGHQRGAGRSGEQAGERRERSREQDCHVGKKGATSLECEHSVGIGSDGAVWGSSNPSTAGDGEYVIKFFVSLQKEFFGMLVCVFEKKLEFATKTFQT